MMHTMTVFKEDPMAKVYIRSLDLENLEPKGLLNLELHIPTG